MGTVNMKNKPEAESFSYAYVEDAGGNLVKVAITDIKRVLGVATSTSVNVTLNSALWKASEDGTYYTQELTITGVTAKSRIDLNPTPEQIIQLLNDEVSMFVSNDAGVVTVYSMNGVPSTTMYMSAVITEVI